MCYSERRSQLWPIARAEPSQTSSTPIHQAARHIDDGFFFHCFNNLRDSPEKGPRIRGVACWQHLRHITTLGQHPSGSSCGRTACLIYCLLCRQNTHSHDTFVHVQLITARTAQIFQSRNTRGSTLLLWCVKSSLSSQRHVSHVVALATEHSHTISLTYITCLPTIFSLTVLSYLGPFLDRTTKPCETHRGVADTPNLHLPHAARLRAPFLLLSVLGRWHGRCCADREDR